MDGFDFAAVFLSFEAALAMAANNPRGGTGVRALHHFERFRARSEGPFQRYM
jgi:hypothetical protein